MHPTFEAAAVALGLVKDNQECRLTLEELIHTSTSSRLRDLFTIFLTHGTCTDAQGLWHEFGWPLAEPGQPRPRPRPGGFLDDCIRQAKTRHGIATHEALPERFLPDAEHDELRRLAAELEPYHMTLESVGIAPPPELHRREEIVEEEREQWLNAAGHPELTEDSIQRRVGMLVPADRELYDEIIADVRADIQATADRSGNSGRARLYFLDGPAGFGKTFMLTLIVDTVRSWGELATTSASSGIAALLLPGGTTTHSKYGLPTDVSQRVACGVSAEWTEIPLSPTLLLALLLSTPLLSIPLPPYLFLSYP